VYILEDFPHFRRHLHSFFIFKRFGISFEIDYITAIFLISKNYSYGTFVPFIWVAELDHWTDKQETKAAVDILIRDTLWAELPECYDDRSIDFYREKIYEYVYTRYKEVA